MMTAKKVTKATVKAYCRKHGLEFKQDGVRLLEFCVWTAKGKVFSNGGDHVRSLGGYSLGDKPDSDFWQAMIDDIEEVMPLDDCDDPMCDHCHPELADEP